MVKKFFINFFIFVVIFFIADIAIGSLVRKAYFSQIRGEYYKTTFILEKGTPDIMILGSSKANYDYVATTIQDSLHLSCFDGGRPAYGISYCNAVVNSILKRYTPKIIIVDILENEFEEKSYKIENKLSCLLPYYKTHPEIRDIVNMKSPFEKYKLVSSLYTFNTVLLPSIAASFNIGHKKEEEQKSKGYEPLTDKWKGTLEIVDASNEKLNDDKIQAFRNIVKECLSKHVKLIAVVSPTFQKYVNNYNPTAEAIKKISSAENIPFLNYTQDTAYINHKNYFYDIRHLNSDGAKIFTADLVKRIQALP